MLFEYYIDDQFTTIRVIRLLAMAKLSSEFTPTGRRVMQTLAFDAYPRIQTEAKAYLKKYREKLMSLQPSDLEALPPYERILQFHELKSARAS